MTQRNPRAPMHLAALVAAGLLTVAMPPLLRTAAAQEKKEAAERQPAPFGQFLTISSPIDDNQTALIRKVALDLQARAEQEDRPAVLVLEIGRGTSSFGSLIDIARFLTSSAASKVRTVAWIPEDVDGNNVILALACKEIVLHPDASLGDIGRGTAVEPEEQNFILSMIEKKYNPRLNDALVRGMLDPAVVVWSVQIRKGDDENAVTETRVVSAEELEQLKKSNAIIEDATIIKQPGVPGRFSGSQARARDVLVSQTLESREDVAAAWNLPRESMRELKGGAETKVRLIRLEGMIEPVMEAFILRQIDRCVSDGAETIIFEIDSYGGGLFISDNLATRISELESMNVRTIGWIPRKAISGGAIIAMGCDEIYMHPDATIGDIGGIQEIEGKFEHVPEKVVSMMREMMRRLAKAKGRPEALALAMVDRELEVWQVTNNRTGRVWYMSEAEILGDGGEWRKGPPVEESRKGIWLTINGERAHELKLAERPVRDIDELRQRLSIPADTVLTPVGKTWVDVLVFQLNRPGAMALLFVVGLVCIILELQMMTGLLGIISAMCFTLFFWSRFLGGTAGWLEVLLFLLGLGCIAMEIFVVPGFGVFGISGGLLVILSIVMASQTFTGFDTQADLQKSLNSLGTVLLSLVAVVIIASLISRSMTQIPLFNRLILSPPGHDDHGDPNAPLLRPELTGGSGGGGDANHALLGHRGVAMTVLRPAGKAQIEDRYVDVVSDGGYVSAGTAVEVVAVTGNRIVVRPV